MRISYAILAALAALAAPNAAAAQEGEDDSRALHISANFQVQIPVGPTASTVEMAKSIADATQQLGDLANRECEALAETFKAECHVEQLNMGANVNEQRFRRNANSQGGLEKAINANLNASYLLKPHVAPKPAPAPAPAQ